MTPMMATALAVIIETSEYRETLFLRLIEALVERHCRVDDLLECGATLRHAFGAKFQPLNRVTWPLGAGTGRETLGPHFGSVLQRFFERRPIFLLLRRQLEPGLERGDPRVGKGADILSARPPALAAGRGVVTLLRRHHRAAGDGERGDGNCNCLPHSYLHGIAVRPLRSVVTRSQVKDWLGRCTAVHRRQKHTAP